MTDKMENAMVKELGETALNMYMKGWAERNGGNISVLLDEKESAAFVRGKENGRIVPLQVKVKELAGCTFLVTGTGKYFKNMKKAPERNMGAVRICPEGDTAEILWGLEDGGNVTSEFSSHLLAHAARRKIDGEHHVIIHTHPVNLICMSFFHEMTDRAFTNALWKTCTECILVFPDGIGVIPWMVSANAEIAALTAQKMGEHRLVLWGQHGIYGAGKNFDEVLGLIETVEKAAEIYLKTRCGPVRQGIDDFGLQRLAETYKLDYRKDYLDL